MQILRLPFPAERKKSGGGERGKKAQTAEKFGTQQVTCGEVEGTSKAPSFVVCSSHKGTRPLTRSRKKEEE